MKAYRLTGVGGERRLELRDEARPTPGTDEVLVAIRATSLNYRDLMVLGGGYARNDRPDVVPLSDGAGEIVEIGVGVRGWAVGDRVAINFMRDWASGPVTEAALQSGFGGGVDGVLAEYVRVPTHALAAIPDGLDYASAATLPCAAVTAWHGLARCGVTAGSTVLLLGTGGVSMFALQFAKAMGAEVVITSSSDDKLERARSLGADHLVNYKSHPEWSIAVRDVLGGRGVDAVIEVGGAGTLEQSMAACRPGGQIALIGVLTDASPDVRAVLLNSLTIHGIYVGSTEMLNAAIKAVEVNEIVPVIDRRFEFGDAAAAFEHLRRQSHVGKVVIENG